MKLSENVSLRFWMECGPQSRADVLVESEEGVGAAGHHGPGRTGRLPPHSGQQGRAVPMRVRKGTGAPGAGRQSSC